MNQAQKAKAFDDLISGLSHAQKHALKHYNKTREARFEAFIFFLVGWTGNNNYTRAFHAIAYPETIAPLCAEPTDHLPRSEEATSEQRNPAT